MFGQKFSELKMDCGYSVSGIKGSITWKGTWTWSKGGQLTSVGTPTVKSSNVYWKPRIPGFKGDSDAMWSNHYCNKHYANMGSVYPSYVFLFDIFNICEFV